MNLVNALLGLLFLTLALLAAAFVGYCLLILWTRYKHRHFPSPQPRSFLFGHLLIFREEMKTRGENFSLLTKWAHKYGKSYVIYFMHLPWVVTCDVQAIQDVLIKENLPKGKLYDAVHTCLGTRFLGSGVLTTLDHAKWAKMRQEYNPAFFKSSLKDLMPEFNSVGNQFIDVLGNFADNGKQIEIGSWIYRAALAVICRVGYGRDLNVFIENSPFNNAVADMGHVLSRTVRDPLIKLPFMAGNLTRMFRKAVELVKSEGRKWTLEREAALKNDEYVANDILNHTLKIREKGILDDNDDILDDFVTFFFAGHETTASAMSSILMLAGLHPEVLRRLYEEVDEVIGQKPHISLEDINKLDYMNLVWKETLRMYPIAPQVFREVDREGFKINGIEVPRGTTVAPCTFMASRMPDYVPNPMEFNPDRFKPDSPDKPVMYATFPFSLGPRNCLGQNFAVFESKVILAKFLQNFNYKLDPTQSFDFVDTTTLGPKDRVRGTLSWKKSS